MVLRCGCPELSARGVIRMDDAREKRLCFPHEGARWAYMRSHHREGLSLESSAVLSLGIVDYDPLALYALRDLVRRSSERIRLLWSVRSRRAALRRLAAVEPVPM